MISLEKARGIRIGNSEEWKRAGIISAYVGAAALGALCVLGAVAGVIDEDLDPSKQDRKNTEPLIDPTPEAGTFSIPLENGQSAYISQG